MPYELSDDGEFFINIRDFSKGFPIMAVTFVNDNFLYSYIQTKSARDSGAIFDFQMTESTDAYISLDFYNDRMYPYNCDGATTATLSLLLDGR